RKEGSGRGSCNNISGKRGVRWLKNQSKIESGGEEKQQKPSYTYWAGTWEEKSLNHLAIPRIKKLLVLVGSISFSSGRAEVEDVTKCVGDALVVVVRNKKRINSYD
ncbi:hypothetical protein RYX36_034045, partial [Vicia faba]